MLLRSATQDFNMLKSLKLIGFQSHQNTVLYFGPGVNAIVGLPLSGKTAIVRAIRWIAKNRAPKGKNKDGGPRFICSLTSHKTALVEVATMDGHVVTLTKGGKIFEYVVDGAKPLHGFGTSVPDVVVEALNFGNLNIQYEWEPPYLMIATPGQVGKALNEVTRLGDLDVWRSEITTEINSISAVIKASEGRLEKSTDKLKALKEAGSDELQVVVNDALVVDSEMEQGLVVLNEMMSLADRYESLTESGRNITTRLLYLESVVKDIDKIDEEIGLIAELLNWRDSVHEVMRMNRIDELANFEEELYEIDSSIYDLEDDADKMAVIIDLESSISKGEVVRSGLITKYRKLLLKKKICPVCGSSIDKATVEKCVEAIA